MLTYDMGTRGKMPRYQFLYQCIRNDILQGVIRFSDESFPPSVPLPDTCTSVS